MLVPGNMLHDMDMLARSLQVWLVAIAAKLQREERFEC